MRNYEWPTCLLLVVIMGACILPFARPGDTAGRRVQTLVHVWFTLTVLAIGFVDVYPKLR